MATTRWSWRPKADSGAETGLLARVVRPATLAPLVLLVACLSLLATAPVDGDFAWGDAPRHAMNGVFVMDLVAAHPIHDPVQWAIHYYLMRPALTIMFYPPLFHAVEAVAFATFGVSHFVAQFTVFLFVVLLAASVYSLARLVLPRWSAVGAALRNPAGSASTCPSPGRNSRDRSSNDSLGSDHPDPGSAIRCLTRSQR